MPGLPCQRQRERQGNGQRVRALLAEARTRGVWRDQGVLARQQDPSR